MKDLFRDKVFFSTMIKLAAPIMLQNLIFSSLGLIDGVMIGQLGESAVAAVGVANQIFFMVNLLIFGIGSGTAIFAAQYWGIKDIPRIKSVLGLSLLMGSIGAAIFALISIFFPVQVISIFSKDPVVIDLGSEYLQLIAFSFILYAISASYAFVLRSTENVRLPLFSSMIALSLNTLLNYALVLGNFGLPALGVQGAGIATVVSRIVETGILLGFIYRRKLPVAARIKDLFNFKLLSMKRYFTTTIPVIATEVIWSLGITTYNIVYARIGTESIAAINIAATLDRILFVIFIGLGSAASIMIGNIIGAGDEILAKDYARKYLTLGAIGAAAFGLVMYSLARPLLSFYDVSPGTIENTLRIISVMALSMPLRTLNFIILIGILRAGGDTRVAFLIDAGSIWCIGVPLALLGAFVLNLPVYWVYTMVMVDELVKMIVGLYRVFSGRWINQLTSPA